MFRSRTELTDFSDAPFRIEVARRQDRHEYGGLPELIDNLIGNDIIPLQFLVSPYLGVLADSLAQDRLECGVKPADSAPLFGCERLVVDVGVADEEILCKAHHVASVFPLALADDRWTGVPFRYGAPFTTGTRGGGGENFRDGP